MATIQLRRKTTSGNGPLTGTSGTIKQGEPLIDLNGGNLYIAKANKTGSSSNPLSASDYLEFVSSGNLTAVLNDKIDELKLGSASRYNVGSGAGNIPVINSDGKLNNSIIPQIAITNTFVVNSEAEMLKLSQAEIGDICVRNDVSKSYILKADPYSTLSNWQELKTPTDKVTSVNGKTGAVHITLSELGGVSASTFNTHKNDADVHLSVNDRNKLEALYMSELVESRASLWENNASNFDSNTVQGGILMRYTITEVYDGPLKQFEIGIDKSKVLTPSSVIDGGTY